jgi:hypothetical protein
MSQTESRGSELDARRGKVIDARKARDQTGAMVEVSK